MSKRSECIANTSYGDDGIRISGHPFVAKLCIYDAGKDHSYLVDECENCGTMSAGFQEGRSEDAEHYPQVIVLGDDLDGYRKLES